MSIDVEPAAPPAEDYEQYRALSTAAVASLIVGLLTPVAILSWPLLVVPASASRCRSWHWSRCGATGRK